MKTRWLVVWCSIVLTALGGGGPLLACGDKALVPSRARRFNLTPSVRRQANVLFYLKPTTSLPDVFNRLSLAAALQKAGYQVTLATDESQRNDYLKQPFDVVVVDLQEALSEPAPASSAAVLAVAVDPSKADLKRAKGRFTTVVKSPSQSGVLIAKLDDTVALHLDAKRKEAKREAEKRAAEKRAAAKI